MDGRDDTKWKETILAVVVSNVWVLERVFRSSSYCIYIILFIYIVCILGTIIVYIWNEAGSEKCLRDFRSRLYIDI